METKLQQVLRVEVQHQRRELRFVQTLGIDHRNRQARMLLLGTPLGEGKI